MGRSVSRVFGGAFILVSGACASIAGLEDPSDFVPDADGGPIVDGGGPPSDVVTADTTPPGDGATEAAPPPCDEPGLLGRWRLQEGTGTRVFDCTSGAHHGDLVAGPTWVDGRTGRKAVSLTGVDAMRVDLKNPTDFRLTGAMTVAAWINARNTMTSGRILSKSGSTGDRGWDFALQSGDQIEFRVATDANTYTSTILGGFPLNAWKHVAAVYEPGVALRVYVDGKQFTSATSGIPTVIRDSTSTLSIGGRTDCCAIDGMVDDARLYGRALSAAEIAALFAAK